MLFVEVVRAALLRCLLSSGYGFFLQICEFFCWMILLTIYCESSESYTTPLGTSLARHLTTHLSHQITYLSTCRPLSITQGNAIRALIGLLLPSILLPRVIRQGYIVRFH